MNLTMFLKLFFNQNMFQMKHHPSSVEQLTMNDALSQEAVAAHDCTLCKLFIGLVLVHVQLILHSLP